MAYFPNSSSSDWLERLCSQCIHEMHCVIRDAHDEYNYTQCKPADEDLQREVRYSGYGDARERIGRAEGIRSVLNALIAPHAEHCSMFVRAEPHLGSCEEGAAYVSIGSDAYESMRRKRQWEEQPVERGVVRFVYRGRRG